MHRHVPALENRGNKNMTEKKKDHIRVMHQTALKALDTLVQEKSQSDTHSQKQISQVVKGNIVAVQI